MHITQTNVIAKLMYNDELRYSDIKPDEMTGNQFSYHLDRLIADKLVEKNQNGLYSLTLKGMRLTDTLSQKTMKQQIQPKSAAAIYAKNERGEVLLQRRGRRPFGGTWNLPSTRIRLKEHPTEALRRAAFERSEIEEAPVRLDKIISIKMGEDTDDFVSDLLVYMFVFEEGLSADYTSNDERRLLIHTDTLSEVPLFPGISEMVAIMDDPNTPFLNEITVGLEYEER